MAPKAKAGAEAKKLVRLKSDVHALDNSGQVFRGFCVWCCSAPAVKETPSKLFAKCQVLPGTDDAVYKLKQMEPEEGVEFDAPAKDVYNCNQGLDAMGFHDIGMCPHNNDPCVLEFLHDRLLKDMIFSSADPLLVVMNPFKDVGNATEKWILEYRDSTDASRLPPHTFSITKFALENYHMVNKSQTVIVSGESGAGKTEATKQMMRYMACAKSGAVDTRIQTAVLAANPVLEAFGNAKTIKNNNSSRFGRFSQLVVAKGGGIEYGSVRGFLLEKNRVIQQESDERSYHIFYQMCKGMEPARKTKLKLGPLTGYKNINPKCHDAQNVDDLAEWKDVMQAFRSMELSEQEEESVYSILSGILLMGNVAVISEEKPGVPDAGAIDPKCMDDFNTACGLLKLDQTKLLEGMTVKISFAAGQELRSFWKKDDSDMLRLSLMKAMFDATFHWLIRKLNNRIEPPNGFTTFMGMLDIFGFEVFKNNSLEQMFINITNEMLQKNFTDVVFDREMKLYREEGISAADIVFTSNKDVIDMLMDKKLSLMAILEDKCLAPGGTDENFLSQAYNSLKNHPKLMPTKVGGNMNFIVVHTIGPIQYNASQWLFKNNDVLKADIMEVVQASQDSVVHALYEGVVIEKGKSAKGQLIGSQFLAQLTALMELINSTEPHFIRCVKPNEEKKPYIFTNDKVMGQLVALSIIEALQLKNLGYSYRRPFKEFLYQFQFCNMGLAKSTTIDPRDAAEKMLVGAKIPGPDWRIGKTMVFLKPDAMKELVHVQRQCTAAWCPIVNILEACEKKRLLMSEIVPKMSTVARLQANIRKQLVLRKTKCPVVSPRDMKMAAVH